MKNKLTRIILGDNFFTTQGVPLNGAVSGVYDISTLSGVPGLIVTVSGNATRTTDNNGMVISVNQNVAYSFSNTLGGNATVDGSFLVGTGLFARESNQLLIESTPIPEPSSAIFLALSSFAFFQRKR